MVSGERWCAACPHLATQHITSGECGAFGCCCERFLEVLSPEEAMGLDEAPEFGVKELYLGEEDGA